MSIKGDKIGKKIIIEGEMLHHVGFRPYLLSKALKLRIKNFEAENDDDDGKQVMVLLIGDTNQISEFINYIKTKKLPLPDTTKVIHVSEEEIDVTIALDIADINEYRRWLSVEQDNNIVQGGLQIVDILKNETNKSLELLRTETTENFGMLGEKVDSLITETDENFKKMDIKYDKISTAMFATVDAIEKRNQILEKRMDNTEKNIEKLLEILIQQKK